MFAEGESCRTPTAPHPHRTAPPPSALSFGPRPPAATPATSGLTDLPLDISSLFKSCCPPPHPQSSSGVAQAESRANKLHCCCCFPQACFANQPRTLGVNAPGSCPTWSHRHACRPDGLPCSRELMARERPNGLRWSSAARRLQPGGRALAGSGESMPGSPAPLQSPVDGAGDRDPAVCATESI